MLKQHDGRFSYDNQTEGKRFFKNTVYNAQHHKLRRVGYAYEGHIKGL